MPFPAADGGTGGYCFEDGGLMVPVSEDFVRAVPAGPRGRPLWRPCRWCLSVPVLLLLFLLPCMAVAGPPLKGPSGSASNLPARKAGLWEVTLAAHASQGPGSAMQPEVTVQQCTNAAAEPVMLLALLPAQESCTETRVARRSGQGGGHDIRTECSSDGRPVRGRVSLWGDLQNIYGGDYSVSFPQTPQNNVGPVAFQGRWLGSCRAGQRPGDMILPNGITVNVVDDAARIRAHAHE